MYTYRFFDPALRLDFLFGDDGDGYGLFVADFLRAKILLKICVIDC